VTIGILSVVALLVEHGFAVDPAAMTWIRRLEAALAGAYLLDRVVMLIHVPERASVVRHRLFEFGVLALFAVPTFALLFKSAGALEWARLFGQDSLQEFGAQLVKLFLLANVLVQILRVQQRLLARVSRPEWILAGSFALLILAGTLLLLLPRASADSEHPIRFLDAFFTATSASCVTGLAVRDVGTALSPFGQGILLVLFQVGGLGIMTFVAFLAVTSAESLPVPQMHVFRQVVGARSYAALRGQLWAIVGFTVLVEAAGAACLYACLPADQDRFDKLGWSMFHAVSAFCNAGFALSADSLTSFQGHAGAMLTFMGLIVLGGLGFLVVTDLLGLQVSRLPLIRRVAWVRRHNQRVPVYRIPLQTKLSTVITGILIVGGTIGFWALEASHGLAEKPLLTQFWISAFQSVTARTAGFNTVPVDQLHPATLLLLMGLMVVGACPVSTGGGIKTVTFAVLLVALRALITGRDRVEIRGRTLPHKVLLAALTVVVLYVSAASLGLFGLALFDPEVPFRSQMFEVVSALSTVGLSTGITPKLSAGSQCVLCLLMFVGRVGTISLVLSVVRVQRPARYQFPEEDLVVGGSGVRLRDRVPAPRQRASCWGRDGQEGG